MPKGKMTIRCEKCDSKKTKLLSKKEVKDLTEGKTPTTLAALPPAVWAALIAAAAAIAVAFIGRKAPSRITYFCQKCHYLGVKHV